jgi:hypothetical protein
VKWRRQAHAAKEAQDRGDSVVFVDFESVPVEQNKNQSTGAARANPRGRAHFRGGYTPEK